MSDREKFRREILVFICETLRLATILDVRKFWLSRKWHAVLMYRESGERCDLEVRFFYA